MAIDREHFRNVGFRVTVDRTDGQHGIILTTENDAGNLEMQFDLTTDGARTLALGLLEALRRIEGEHGRR